tara:strand:- start:6646 stop:7659 length:1014 start_codon:yes stop_codon:yes gene_type:complete
VFITYFFIKYLYPKLENFIKNPNGPQKIHSGNVPRLGGASIFLSLCLASLFEYSFCSELRIYLIIAMPVFLVGFFEDIKQSIKPSFRLLSACLSALAFVLINDISISRLEFSPVDFFLQNELFSLIFTVICIVFLTQAFNIIDGLNGLSLSTAITCLIAIGIIMPDQNNDTLFNLTSLLIFILLGVLIFNFPGKIFIGDSGSYLLGLFVAMFVVTLFEQNTWISPLAVVQLLMYPSYELIRSVVRRIIKKKNIFKPDKKHLHSLIYLKNLNRYRLTKLNTNILSSFTIIFLQILNLIYVILFYQNNTLLILGVILFIFLYEMLCKITTLSITKLCLK